MSDIVWASPSWDVLGGALLVLVLRVVGVALSTVRMLVMMHGRKLLSVGLGFFEVLAYVVAIGKVTHDLGNAWNILGYCVGFCGGTLAGMALHERMVHGHSIVRIVSKESGRAVLDAVHGAGFGATMESGTGRGGNVSIVTSVLPRKEVSRVCELAHAADTHSFVTVEDAKSVMRGYLGPGQREK